VPSSPAVQPTDTRSDGPSGRRSYDPMRSATPEDQSIETRRVQQTHPIPRKYLEFAQDVIVFCLCALLLVTMGIKLFHLTRLLIQGTDFSSVVGDILFVLVLVELFRLLLIYLEEHRVSVATMVEVGIVATLREVILIGALQIQWQQLLVVCAFILVLTIVLRHSGIRTHPTNPGAAINDYQG
jgi:uncharacterized membrane protein (DUF373 family)